MENQFIPGPPWLHEEIADLPCLYTRAYYAGSFHCRQKKQKDAYYLARVAFPPTGDEKKDNDLIQYLAIPLHRILSIPVDPWIGIPENTVDNAAPKPSPDFDDREIGKVGMAICDFQPFQASGPFLLSLNNFAGVCLEYDIAEAALVARCRLLHQNLEWFGIHEKLVQVSYSSPNLNLP